MLVLTYYYSCEAAPETGESLFLYGDFDEIGV